MKTCNYIGEPLVNKMARHVILNTQVYGYLNLGLFGCFFAKKASEAFYGVFT